MYIENDNKYNEQDIREIEEPVAPLNGSAAEVSDVR